MGTNFVTQQHSLSAGELSPGVWGRQDLEKVHSGTTTSRNFFANYRGGVSSRAGLAYVGTCKQQYPVPPRDIPFQFNIDQGYILEFGELYMRVKFQGAYVTETSETVISVNSVGVFNVTSHSYSVGDWVSDIGNTGFSGLTWIVHTVIDANNFTVTDLFGNVISSATTSGAGSVSRIYTTTSPYHAIDLPYLKYTQSADVMTLCCVNIGTSTEYPPYSLTRTSNTSWTFTIDTFAATLQAPLNLVVTAQSSDVASVWYSYVVTAVNDNTGEESVASLPATVQNNDIALSLGSNTVVWSEVTDATSYNIYAATPSYSVNVPVSSLFGFVGRSLGPAFTDTNITADFTKVPPQHNDPFARGVVTDVVVTAIGNGNYSPTTIGYSVTTSTGSGFDGVPVVDNGTLAGFVIRNSGKNYLPGDTIAFTDSGGGVASGTITFSANPVDTSITKINSIQIAFTATPDPPAPPGQYIYSIIQSTPALTAQTLANTLNASSLQSLSSAIYSASGSVVTIKYKTPGAVGNAFTLAAVSGTTNITFSGANLTGGGNMGSGATATLTIGPESQTYPSVPAYFQQRRVYANSLNNPDTYWMSQPGLFTNMDSSIPVTAADSITGTPWAQQVNGIQFMVPMPGGLVVLTGKQAWQVNGGASAAITPSSQVATPQAYNGCNSFVQPINIDYDILYVQSKGSIWRDLSYNFFTNIYTGTDLTLLSNHLFTGYSMVQACYAEEPYKLVWTVRDDGILLCLTYLKPQDVYSWTRHDTNGLFVGICTITEPPVDAVYVITQRYVQGAWRYYSERMDNRIWNDVEDTYCIDAGLMSGMTFPNAVLSPSASVGSVTLNASSSVFNSGQVGQVIRVDGGKATITSYVSGTQVIGIVTDTIVQTVPNDPNNTPLPAQSGSWSIAPLVSSVINLNHLEGLTVTGLMDGSVIPLSVVTNGAISLPNPASKVVIGLPYVCQVQTMYLDAPSQTGTVQNRRKDITGVGLRVESSRGIKLGANQPNASSTQFFANVPWGNLTEIKDRTNLVNAGVGIPLYTGDYYLAITSGWDLRGFVAIQQDYPLPANILSVISYWMAGEDK